MHALNIKIFGLHFIIVIVVICENVYCNHKKKRTKIHKVAFTVYKHHKICNIQH